MRNVTSKKRADAILASWLGMTKGQKKYLFLVSPLISLLMSMAFVLGVDLAWALGQMTAHFFTGSPDDGLVSNMYYAVSDLLAYWWVVLISPAITLLVFGGVEIWSRKSAR